MAYYYLLTRAGERCWPVGSSHVLLGASQAILLACRQKKKQPSEAEIALRRKETAHKGKHLSEKELKTEKVRISSLL